MKPVVIEQWHQMVNLKNIDGFNTLLADDAIIFSPAKNSAIEGKVDVFRLLSYVKKVILNTNFKYVNEWYSTNSAVLEFETVCDGIRVNGVDIVTWNENNQIIQIKVMVRPLKALNKVIEMMNQVMQAGH